MAANQNPMSSEDLALFQKDLALFHPNAWMNRHGIRDILQNVFKFLNAISLAMVMQQPILRQLINNDKHLLPMRDCNFFRIILDIGLSNMKTKGHSIRIYCNPRESPRFQFLPIRLLNGNVLAEVIRNRDNEHLFTKLKYGIFDIIQFKISTLPRKIPGNVSKADFINEIYKHRLIVLYLILKELGYCQIRVYHLFVQYWPVVTRQNRDRILKLFRFARLN